MPGVPLITDKEVLLTVYHSQNADHAGDRVQSFLSDQTQQGYTYIPLKETTQSRDKRIKRVIQDTKRHFPDSSSAHWQAQGGKSSAPSGATTNTAGHEYTYHGRSAIDLYGIGQQFHGHSHQ